MSSTPGVFVAARRFFCTLCGTRPRPVSATASRAKRSADSIAAPRIASMNPLRRSRLTRLNSPYASLAAFTASSTVPKTPCSGSAGALAGACGAGCNPDEECQAGQCVCAVGLAGCGGACIDTNNDPYSCGGCNVVCAWDEVCENGRCASCAPYEGCDNYCTDIFNDPANCGACGVVCAFDEVCSAGACTACASPLADCGGGVCVDLDYDQDNCGACGGYCGSDQSCNQGSCACSLALDYCGGGVCVDINWDPYNCRGGGCNCGADQYCDGGTGECDGGNTCGSGCLDAN